MNAEQIFRAKAPWIMALLMRDFPIELLDAAAIVGNLGHESGGFASMQEKAPTVKGSAGGWGWAQWTGPRRRAFEAYCKRNSLDPASDEANYKYLFLEMKGIEGSEARTIPAVTAAEGLKAKVVAFEKAFERAGVKHYPSRQKWAERALDAWKDATDAEKIPPFEDGRNVIVIDAIEKEPDMGASDLVRPSPVQQSKKAIGGGLLGGTIPALLQILVTFGVLPAAFLDPAVMTVLIWVCGAIGGAIGAYMPRNAA